MIRLAAAVSVLVVVGAAPPVLSPAFAQTTVPQVTTANPGYLFPNDRYQREREQRNRAAASERRNAPAPRQCSADALPPAERRAMEARYNQIERAQGYDAAQAYAREQGRLFRERLIAEGVCAR